MRPGERLEAIRARLAYGGYGRHTEDVAYLIGTIEMMERIFHADRIARLDPDNSDEGHAPEHS